MSGVVQGAWRMARGGRAAVLALGLMAVAAVGVQAQDTPSAVIVFDGSGSMRAPLEATRLPKVGVAREAVLRALQRIPGQTRVGLAAFGHRRGDCADIEVIRNPAPVDAAATNAAIEKLNPRGRGPIAQSLRVAAKALPPAGQRSLVLIYDDADNCAVDLCAAAAELAKAKIVVHAVGLGLKAEDRPKMACLPQLTGGRFYNAATPEQAGAAIEEALRLAANAVAEPPPPEKHPLQGLEAAAAVPDDAPRGLYLRARLAAASSVLMQPLHWVVLPEGEGRVAAFDARAANPYLDLPPGTYTVEVRDGAATARASVTVLKDKPTAAYVALEAGTLRVRVLEQRSRAQLTEALVTIASLGPAAEPAKDAPPGTLLASFRSAKGSTILPAGRHLVRAELGLVGAQGVATVAAGQETAVEISLEFGRLALAGNVPAPAEPVVFSVLEDDPDAPGGRREIVRSADRQPEFVLRPGSYTVILRQGAAEARERAVLGPGETVRRTLQLPAAIVNVSSRLGDRQLGERLFYLVERLDGAGPSLTTSKPAPSLLLASGRYRIEGRYGAMNARAVREVEVKAGAPAQSLVLDQQAAILRLKAANPPGEVFWEVRDPAGAQVWATGVAEPDLTLQAGSYTIRAQARDKVVEQRLELRVGEQRSLDVAFE